MQTHERSLKVVRDGEGRQFTVMGATATYKATAEDTGGAYSLSVDITPPHGGVPLHVHNREDEAMYIIEGEYEIQCGDRTVRVTKGAFVFLPKGVPNRFENATDAPARHIHITSPGGFERFMEQMALIASDGPPDKDKMREVLRKHEIEMM